MENPWYNAIHTAGYFDLLGNWCITKDLQKIHILYIKDILHLLTEDNIKSVFLKSIAWKNKHKFPKPWIEDRYKKADIKYKGIITTGHNPYNNEYRMIDGRRRMHKLLSNGVIKSNFYVIPWEKIKPFFKEHNSTWDNHVGTHPYY